jgi:transcriptional regulator with XRE-family HTH domain
VKLGERIATWRQHKGLTQADLAEKLDIFPAAVAQWEIGDTSPTAHNIERMAKAFRVSMEEFYGPLPEVPDFRKPKRRVS